MKKIYILFFLLLCQQWLSAQGDMAMNAFSTTHLSQKIKTDHTLLGVLDQIEKKFSVFFNFDPELISDKDIDDEVTISDDLNETLERILKPLGLVYQKLGSSYYVIFAGKKQEVKEKVKPLPELPKSSERNLEGRKDTKVGVINPLIPRSSNFSELLQYGFDINGQITDSEGEPLIGVNIQVKGTNAGTSTDFEGRFSLEGIDENAVLVVSYIGYVSQEVAVAGKSTISITMASDSQLLDEVVVVGYGTIKRSDLTGSVGTLSEKDFKQRVPTNVQQGLAGRISGVDVSQNSGRPGGRSTVRIRGNTSITGSNEPLYVIDGVVMSNSRLSNGSSPMDYFDPSNVESIEVLKDASATAIYGSRGANGVVLITTSTPKSTGSNIRYNGSVSTGKLPKKIDLLNAEEFLRLEEIAFNNAAKFGLSGVVTDPKLKRNDPILFDASGNPLYDTDWQDEGYRSTLSHNHQLSLSGKHTNSIYEMNLGYKNEEGLLLNSDLERYSARFFMDTDVKKWLTLGGNINYSLQKESQPRAVGSGAITPTRSVLQALPITPVRYPDGSFGRTLDYPGVEGGAQPVRLVNETTRNIDGYNLLGNVNTNIKINKDIDYRALFGVNLLNQEIKFYAGHDLQFISEDGSANLSQYNYNSWQFEHYVNYTKLIANTHSINGLIGMSWERSSQFSSSSSAENFIDDYFKFNNLGLAANVNPLNSNSSANSLNSYFTRWNYVLQNRYILTVTARVDGSSRFSSKNRYAFFPSGAVGWRLSEEEFMKNIDAVSNLKIRGSYGLTGNSNIGNYQTITGLGNYHYYINGSRVAGIGVSRMGNPNLKWEKNSQIDFGVELGLFNNRISLEGDVYYKRSEDMLLNAPVPSSSGYTNVTRNIGSMENRGFEFSLRTFNIDKSEFSWTTGFNISINKNKVLKLTGGQDIVQGGNPVTGNRIIREGEPVNSFYGLVQTGIWSTSQEEEAKRYGRLSGDIRYLDVNDDGAINEDDRMIIGNGNPDGYGSIMNNIQFKNFELTLDIQFMYGNDVSFDSKSTTQDRVGITNVLATVLDAWTPDNQDTDIPQIRPVAGYRDRLGSTSRIYNGSFLRGRNLSVSYNFPTALMNSAGISNGSISLSLQNFFLLTEYSGYDPEVSSSADNFTRGYDLYSYPKPRVLLFAINLGL